MLLEQPIPQVIGRKCVEWFLIPAKTLFGSLERIFLDELIDLVELCLFGGGERLLEQSLVGTALVLICLGLGGLRRGHFLLNIINFILLEC